MNMKNAAVKAVQLGIKPVGLKKVELVRLIQVAEDNPPCYATETIVGCEQLECCWRDDCAKMYKRG